MCGDYLSDVEIPMIGRGGSLHDYRATLARLAPLVERAETVVPGHGSPHDPRRGAGASLDEDLAYLDALEAGRDGAAPGPGHVRQREIHAENVAKHVG